MLVALAVIMCVAIDVVMTVVSRSGMVYNRGAIVKGNPNGVVRDFTSNTIAAFRWHVRGSAKPTHIIGKCGQTYVSMNVGVERT